MSKVSIVNKALALLGANRITNMNDGTEEAKSASNVYEQSLRSILSEACWGFAAKRALLNKLTDVPVWGGGSYFQMPSDCVRIFDVMDRRIKWRIEGDHILADAKEFGVLYVAYTDDDALYTPSFVDAFACRLACDMCFDLTNSASRQTELLTIYRGEYLPMARNANARDKSSEEIDDGAWVESVYGWREG